MAEELISAYIDRAAIKADTDFFLTQIKTVFDAYSSLGNTKANLSFADGIKNTTNGISQLNEALKETTTISKEASKATAEEAKILALAAKAAKDAAAEKKLLAQAAAAEAKTSAENAKVKAEEAKALKELYNAEKAEASSLRELAQVEKIEAQTRKENALAALKEQQALKASDKQNYNASDIPYTNNLEQLESEQLAAERTGQVVSDLEKEQLEAQIAATEWANAQKVAAEQVAAANQTIKKGEEDNYDLLIGRKAELKSNIDQQKLYEKQLAEGAVTFDQYSAKIKQLIIEEKELKLSIADINTEIKNSAKVDYAAPNSIDEAKANITVLRNERDATDVNDIERITELNALIDKNNQLIDANSDKLAKQKINIGNYPTAFSGAFKFLNDELASVEGKLSGPGLSGQELENLTLKQEVLRNATALVGQEFSSTTAQQNAFKEAATQIGVVFGKDSETFRQFNQQVKVGKAELDGVKNAMSGAEVAGNKFGRALGGIWSGLRQIAAALPGLGIATLIGLLLTPLSALGAELLKFVKTSNDAGKETEDLNEKLKSQAEIIEETKSKFSSAAANVAELKEQVALAKQGFIDKDQVVKQYNETMGKTVGTVKDLDQVEQQLTQNGEAYIRFTLLKAAAQVAYSKAAEQAFEAEQTSRKKAEEFKNTFTDVHVVAFGSTSFNARDYEYQQQQIKVAQEKRKQEEVANQKDKEQKLLDIANDFEKQAAEISKNFHFSFFGNGKEDTKLKEFIDKFFADELKAQQDAYTKISQSDTVYLDTRLAARKRAYELEYQIIEGQKNYELAVEKNKLDSVINYAKSTKNEKINAQNEYAARVKEINEKVAFQEKDAAQKLVIDLGVIRRKQIDDDIALIKKEQEEIAALDKKKLDDELKAEQDRIKSRQDQDAINQDTELRVLDLEYQKKLISEEEYQKKRFEIEKYYSLKRQADAISDLEKQIQKAKDAGQNTLELERKTADLRASIDDELTKRLLDNRDKLAQKEREVANQVIGAVQSLIDNGYERQKNALQDQIDTVDTKKQREIDAVNASLDSEEKKAAQIAIINARADDQKAQLEKKQKEQDVKKAQFDKLIGILQVGIETQKNVSSLSGKAAQAKAEAALLAANPLTAAYAPIATAAAAAIAAQIPLALAQGAIQAGLIAAQPIPKYKTGTDYHIGGLMWAGDGGKSEIVIPPNGNAFTTPSIATLYDMPAGTVVLPDANQAIEQSFNMMYKPVLPAMVGSGDMQLKMLSRKMDAVINAINNIPGTKVVNTWSGVEASYQNVSRLWEYINRNTQSR